MGIEPFLLASSIICVLAQRLVRVICPHCKEPYTPPKQELDYLNLQDPPDMLFHGKGCDKCLGKGYLGRTGIYELLEITPDLRTMTGEKKDAQTIREAAVRSGFKDLQRDAIFKVVRGVTTVEEVLRVTHSTNVQE
jgi:type II secretory ATPase GspE/PulE/Tfp pilus assembly ATPase PilB-like protein